MSNLIKRKRPEFVFFPQELFYDGQVDSYVMDIYEHLCDERGEWEISSGHMMSAGTYYYKMGVVGRVLAFNENVDDSPLSHGLTEAIKDMAVDFRNDIETLANQFQMFPMDRKLQAAFRVDIENVLDANHVFYFKHEHTPDFARYFDKMGDYEMRKFYRNIPIREVW